MSDYLFSFTHNGDRYSLQISADTSDEAKLKVLNMGTASYDGELMAVVKERYGWAAKFVVWLRSNWS